MSGQLPCDSPAVTSSPLPDKCDSILMMSYPLPTTPTDKHSSDNTQPDIDISSPAAETSPQSPDINQEEQNNSLAEDGQVSPSSLPEETPLALTESRSHTPTESTMSTLSEATTVVAFDVADYGLLDDTQMICAEDGLLIRPEVYTSGTDATGEMDSPSTPVSSAADDLRRDSLSPIQLDPTFFNGVSQCQNDFILGSTRSSNLNLEGHIPPLDFEFGGDEDFMQRNVLPPPLLDQAFTRVLEHDGSSYSKPSTGEDDETTDSNLSEEMSKEINNNVMSMLRETSYNAGASARSRTPPPPPKSAMFSIGKIVKKFDSVDSIMDRIDEELYNMKAIQVPLRTSPSERGDNSPLPPKSICPAADKRPVAAPRLSQQPASPASVEDTYDISIDNTHNRLDDLVMPGVIPETVIEETELTEDTIGDHHSEVDSEYAKEIDARYSEILKRKQVGFGDRVSQLKSQAAAAHAIETDSIRTEDFETAFHNALGNPELGVQTLHYAASESSDTPLTEDFEEKFKATLVKQVAGVPVTSFGGVDTSETDTINTDFIRRKLKQAGAGKLDIADLGADTLDELSDIEQDINMNCTITPFTRNNHNYDAESESEEGDIVKEIREESCRIQKEIELERKSRKNRMIRGPQGHPVFNNFSQNGSLGRPSHSLNSFSVSTPDISSLNPQPTRQLLHSQIAQDNLAIQKMNHEKMLLLQEVSKLQETLKTVEQDVTSTERQAKDNRARAEEARSQMMLAEFKREATLKEIQRLSGEVEESKQIIQEAEQRKYVREREDVLGSFGLTKEELSDLLAERNQLRSLIQNQNNSLQLEKDQLERTLNATKCELLKDQQKFSTAMDALEETIAALKGQLDEIKNQRDELAKENSSLTEKNLKMEHQLVAIDQERKEAVSEKALEVNQIREQLQRELMETRMQLNNELSSTKRMLKMEEDKSHKLHEELQLRDELNIQMREELDNVRMKAAEEEQSHDDILRELKKQMNDMEGEKKEAFKSFKQKYDLEQLKLIEASREELERQHEETLMAVKDEYSRQMSQQQQCINGKDEEICLLRSRLGQQEDSTRKLTDRLKADIKIQIDQAVQAERQMWEKEQKYLENTQLKHYKDEVEKQQRQWKEQLDSESKRAICLEEQYKSVKGELEDQRQHNQRLYQDKLQAIAKSKEEAQQEKNHQIEKIRQQLEDDSERVIQKLKTDLLEKDEEIQKMKLEKSNLVHQETETAVVLDKLEKMVVNEINDECRKTANFLGVSPRKATLTGFRSPSPSKGVSKRASSRSLTASAIANLRACNEELRNSVTEVKEEVEALKVSLHQAYKSKELELEKVRKHFSRDKAHDMDDLKSRLAQEHREEIDKICHIVSEQSSYEKLLKAKDSDLRSIQANMNTWKDETASRIAAKFDKELSLQLRMYLMKLERRSTPTQVRRSRSPDIPSRRHNSTMYEDELEDHSATHMMHSVQDRLKQLRTSGSRNRGHLLAVSTPDISNSGGGAAWGMDNLEQKVKLAELKAQLAEERASRNQAMLSHKMQEVNQLQNTLNSQTKEILSLEKSFDDLKHTSYSPSKYGLNHSFPH